MSLQVKRKVAVVEENYSASDGTTFDNESEALRYEKVLQLKNRFGETITPEELLDNASDIMEWIKWSGLRGTPWGRKRGTRTRKEGGVELRDVNEEMVRELSEVPPGA